jgi:hypothetical protein
MYFCVYLIYFLRDLIKLDRESTIILRGTVDVYACDPLQTGAGSSDFAILTFLDFVSLTGGSRRGGSHLLMTQS